MNEVDLELSRSAIVDLFNTDKFKSVQTCSTSGPGAVSQELSVLLGHKHGSGFRVFGHHVFVHRINDSSRMTLFARTPIWSRGEITSTREMLSRFGYLRNGSPKLNCTLRYRTPNTQGLFLDLEDEKFELASKHVGGPSKLYVWAIDNLLDSLSNKHDFAVMVNVESLGRTKPERFRIVSLTFYSSPRSDLLVGLIREGAISIDHLISQNEKGQVSEKGPIIKLERSKFLRLFANVKTALLR